MAIDYGIQVPQIQPMQQPNMLQQIMTFNQLNEARREVEEKNALRQLLSRPDIDPSSPSTLRQIVAVAPKAGPAVVAALARANADQRAGEKSSREGELAGTQAQMEQQRLQLAQMQQLRDQAATIPGASNPAEAYARIRAQLVEKGVQTWPEQYPGPEGLNTLLRTADQALEQAKSQRFEIGGVPVESVPGSGVAREMRIVPAQPGGPAPAPGRPQADVTGVPSYPVNPTRMAAMNAAAQRFAPELMNDGAAAPAAPPMPPARPATTNAMSPFGAAPSANMLATAPGGRPASEVIAERERAAELRKAELARLQTIAQEEAKAGVKKSEEQKTLGSQIDAAVKELTAAAAPGGLISKSTGSGLGSMVDTAAGFVGIGTPGAVAGAQLGPIADLALKLVPRFEGPQSDKDTQSYKEAAGSLANTSLPVNVRQAAAKEVVRLLKNRREQFTMEGATAEPGKITDRAPAGGVVKWDDLK